MLELLFCGNNLTCGFGTIKDWISGPKYPPDVAQICMYFEEQKEKLPEYCKFKQEPFIPRRRSEF
jgi:hypothetical protein